MLLTVIVVTSGCDYCDAQRQDGGRRRIENTVWLSCSQRHAGNCRQLHVASQPIQSSRDSGCLAGTVTRDATHWTESIEIGNNPECHSSRTMLVHQGKRYDIGAHQRRGSRF